MRAERENSEAVGVDADSDEEAENAEGTQDPRSRSEAMHGCELGPRSGSMPIVFHGSQSIQSAPYNRKVTTFF